MFVEGTLGTGSQDTEQAISSFFQRLANAFLSGDHDWLAGIYIYPLVIYIEGEIALEHTPEVTLSSLFERRRAALAIGTTHIHSTVTDIGDHNCGRFPVNVKWKFLSATGRVLACNVLRYFCRFDEHGEMKIEILEFVKRGAPNLAKAVPGSRLN